MGFCLINGSFYLQGGIRSRINEIFLFCKNDCWWHQNVNYTFYIFMYLCVNIVQNCRIIINLKTGFSMYKIDCWLIHIIIMMWKKFLVSTKEAKIWQKRQIKLLFFSHENFQSHWPLKTIVFLKIINRNSLSQKFKKEIIKMSTCKMSTCLGYASIANSKSLFHL